MIMVLFGALSAGTETYSLFRSDRHGFYIYILQLSLHNFQKRQKTRSKMLEKELTSTNFP